MTLDGTVVSRSISDADDLLIDEIASIRAFLRQLAELFKMIRQAVEEQQAKSEHCMNWVKETSLTLQNLQERIQNIEDKLNGYY